MLSRLILGMALVVLQTACAQLNPDREPHSHTEHVRTCMQPYLEKYSYFAQDACDAETVRSTKNTCEDMVTDASNLNFRPSSQASLVEIAPRDAPDFDHVALNENDRMLLYYLATCTAYVGAKDYEGENAQDEEWVAEELEFPLTEETIQDVWGTKFLGEKGGFPHSHAEERYFKEGDEFYGGNRVVYLQEFMQEIVPDLYWKVRETAAKAVEAGNEKGVYPPRNGRHYTIPQLGIREIEYVEYRYQEGIINHLNWHRDDDSVYTMVMMLDDPSVDFEGGNFSIKTRYAEDVTKTGEETAFDQDESSEIVYRMTQGSGVMFDAHTHHRASSVTTGFRKVLVIEFWIYGEVDGWEWRPPLDRAFNYPAATREVVPDECDLNHGVYQRVCWE